VAWRVGISIQNDEAMEATIDDPGSGVIAGCNCVTEDASRRFLGGGNVGVAPRGPEVIHYKAG
jgi:hypothetical protein